MLTHGASLRKLKMPVEQVVAVITDYRNAGLPPQEVAVMALAEKVARNAHEVTQADVDAVRAQGLSDEEVFDVILAAAARSFFTKVYDGSGTEVDPRPRAEEPEIWAAIIARERAEEGE
jgi:alkylhydroperoxidase family enzyme